MIDAVPGLSSVSVDHREINQTFGSKNIVVVSADSSGALSTDPNAFAEYLIKVGYSVNQWEPTSGLQVILSDYDGPSLVDALKSEGGDGVVQESSGPGEFFITSGVLKSRYGR